MSRRKIAFVQYVVKCKTWKYKLDVFETKLSNSDEINRNTWHEEKTKRKERTNAQKNKESMKNKTRQNNKTKKKNRSFRGMTCDENICWQFYLAGVDLQLSAFEQYFVAAVATAALNASSKGWFH